jgi:hypothetical protein
VTPSADDLDQSPWLTKPLLLQNWSCMISCVKTQVTPLSGLRVLRLGFLLGVRGRLPGHSGLNEEG